MAILSLAVVTSHMRGALAAQSEQVTIQTIDNELMALAAKHNGSHMPNGMTAILLTIFAVLGGVFLSFDVQDALEQEAAEPCVDELSKEITMDEGHEQQCEAQSPALWPCRLFQLRGSMRSLIVVVAILSLAVATSHVRGVLSSPSEQANVQTVDNELMAL